MTLKKHTLVIAIISAYLAFAVFLCIFIRNLFHTTKISNCSPLVEVAAADAVIKANVVQSNVVEKGEGHSFLNDEEFVVVEEDEVSTTSSIEEPNIPTPALSDEEQAPPPVKLRRKKSGGIPDKELYNLYRNSEFVYLSVKSKRIPGKKLFIRD